MMRQREIRIRFDEPAPAPEEGDTLQDVCAGIAIMLFIIGAAAWLCVLG
jgi:hypothetical protein